MISRPAELAGTQVPAALLEQASLLGGELAWPATAARGAIQWLADHGQAVVGVELWQNVAGTPKWIASSDYQVEAGSLWAGTVRACADHAQAFVERFAPQRGALFNLTWVSQDALQRA